MSELRQGVFKKVCITTQ